MRHTCLKNINGFSSPYYKDKLQTILLDDMQYGEGPLSICPGSLPILPSFSRNKQEPLNNLYLEQFRSCVFLVVGLDFLICNLLSDFS